MIIRLSRQLRVHILTTLPSMLITRWCIGITGNRWWWYHGEPIRYQRRSASSGPLKDHRYTILRTLIQHFLDFVKGHVIDGSVADSKDGVADLDTLDIG